MKNMLKFFVKYALLENDAPILPIVRGGKHTIHVTLRNGGSSALIAQKINDTFYVRNAHVDETLRHKGLGLTMYKAAIEKALQMGAKFASDTRMVSPDAAAVWEKLKSCGYRIYQDPSAIRRSGGGWWGNDIDPVFRVM